MQGSDKGVADERSSVQEGLRDLAVIEAMLASGVQRGSKTSVLIT